MRIFMIDDELSVVTSISRSLFLFDITVDYSQNARQAIPIVETGAYDFVLLDYYMPEYSGEWFMQHVRLPSNTKVILFTGYASNTVIKRMTELGVSDCWIKPLSTQQIVKRLNHQAELVIQ